MPRFNIYSRVPSAAVKPLFDGKEYVHVPHTFYGEEMTVIEDFSRVKLMRFDSRSFHRNGEAYVYIGSFGQALQLRGCVPSAITVELKESAIVDQKMIKALSPAIRAKAAK